MRSRVYLIGRADSAVIESGRVDDPTSSAAPVAYVGLVDSSDLAFSIAAVRRSPITMGVGFLTCAEGLLGIRKVLVFDRSDASNNAIQADSVSFSACV